MADDLTAFHSLIVQGGQINPLNAAFWGAAPTGLSQRFAQLRPGMINAINIEQFDASQMRFTGTGDFAGYSTIAVAVVVLFGPNGEALNALMRYTLPVNATTGLWRFGEILPDLPPLAIAIDFDDSRQDPVGFATSPSLLGTLDFAEPAIVIAANALSASQILTAAEQVQVAVDAGVTFIGAFIPKGVFGLMEAIVDQHAAGVGSKLPVYGPLYLPIPSDSWDQVDWTDTVWPSPQPVPGVHLMLAPLGSGAISLGKQVSINRLLFHLYTPHSQKWQATSPATASYLPSKGFEVDVTIGGGDLQLQGQPHPHLTLTSALFDDFRMLILDGEFEDMSIGNLAALAGLTGGDSYDHEIPSVFSNALGDVAKLASRLSLDRLKICVGPGSTGLPAIPWVEAVIGLGSAKQPLFPSIDLDELALRLVVTDPFTAPKVGVIGMGLFRLPLSSLAGDHAELLIEVGKAGATGADWLIIGKLIGGVAINLSHISSHFLGSANLDIAGVDSGTIMSIDRLELVGLTGQFIELDLLLDHAIPWSFSILGKHVAFHDVAAKVRVEQGGATALRFAGVLDLGPNFSIAAQFVRDTALDIGAQFNRLTLRDFLDLFGLDTSALPDAVDFAIDNGALRFQKGSTDLLVSAGGLIEGFGPVFLAVDRSSSSGWGCEIGIRFDVNAPTQMAGLGSVASWAKDFGLDDFSLYFTNLAQPSADFGQFAGLNAPSLNGAQPLVRRPQSAVARLNQQGLWLTAALSLATDTHGVGRLLRFLGLDVSTGTLQAQLFIGAGATQRDSLFLELDNVKVSKPGAATINGYLGIAFDQGDIELNLGAQYLTEIDGQKMEFDLQASVMPTGFLVAGDYVGPAITLGPVMLDQIGLVVGIDDAGVPSLGFAAQILDGSFHSSIAVFLDSVDPAKSMFAGSLSNLNLLDVATHLTGLKREDIPDFLQTALGDVAIEGKALGMLAGVDADQFAKRDLAAISAALSTALGTKVPANPVGNASLDQQLLLLASKTDPAWYLTDLTTMKHYCITGSQQSTALALSSEAQIQFVPETTSIGPGIVYQQGYNLIATVSMFGETLDLDIEISTGRGIRVDTSLNQPIRFITHHIGQFYNPADPTRGPDLFIQNYDNPADPDPQKRNKGLRLHCGVKLLALTTDVVVELGAGGYHFHLDGSFGGVIGYGLDGDIDPKGGSASLIGQLSLSVSGILLDWIPGVSWEKLIGISAKLTIRVDSNGAFAGLNATFDVLNHHFDGAVDFDVNRDDFNNFVALFEDHVKQTLRGLINSAESFVDAAGQDVLAYGGKMITTLEDAAVVLRDVFNVVVHDAASLLQQIEDDLDRVVDALHSVFQPSAHELCDAVSTVWSDPGAIKNSLGRYFYAAELAPAMALVFPVLLGPSALIDLFRSGTPLEPTLGPKELAAILAGATFGLPGPSIILAALASAFGNDDAAQALPIIAPGAPPNVLASIMNAAGFSPLGIVSILTGPFALTYEVASSALSALGIDQGTVRDTLLDVGAPLSIVDVLFPISGIAKISHSVFGWP